MAKFAENLYTASGATANFVVSFPFIERSHVSVYLDDVLTAAYTWVDDSNITLDSIPSAGVIVKIVRDSSSSARLTNFNDGSRLTESDLDQDGDQAFYLIQESRDKIVDVDTDNAAIIADIDELELNQDDLVTLSGVAENSTDLGTFTGTTISDNVTVKGGLQEIETAIETNITNIATNASDITTNASDLIAGDTATLVAAKAYADAISGENLSPWSSGVLYEVDDVVEYLNVIYQCITQHTSTGSFDGTKFDIISRVLSDSEVKLAYENNADTNAFTDAEKTKLGTVETGATADQTGAEIKVAYEAEADTNAFTDADHSKLDGIEAGATADQDLSNYVQDGGDAQLDSTGATDTLTVTKSGSGDAIDISNSGSGASIRVNTDEFIVDGGVVDVKSDLNVGGVTTIKDEAVSTEANLLQVQSNDGTETFLGVRNGHVDILGELDITHTAVAPDEHALEIDVDAAGIGDIKAIDVVYVTGAISTGDDEAIILVNVDESAATGGDVTALEVLATEGSVQVNGMLAGINVNPVEQLSGTFGDMDSALVNATNRLTEFTTAGTDIEMFSADNDTVTIGNATKFEEIEFLFATTASQNIRPTFEYSTGVGTWASFTPVDGTNGCRTNGVIVWLDGDIPSWTVGTGSEYLIRITRTRNALTTAPIESLVQIGIAEEYYWNKTGDIKTNSVTLDSTVTLKEQTSTPSTPASGYKSIYPKDNGKLYTLDDTGTETEVGSGAGGGGINYLEGDNFNAETSVGDWATYADAAGENPVDGTGGSATVTFAQNSTTPLRGDADFKLVKDAANRQGEGASCAFTIDKADQAQKLTISFDYDTSDADYADDDIRLSVYDVTNASLIRINGEDLKGGKGTHYAQFQSASDSTSYRLIAHVSSTNAAAYDLYFDNFKVGPTNLARGAIVTDWEEYTPTVVGLGTISASEFEYSRQGDSIVVRVSFTSGTSTATEAQIPLPSGLSIKTGYQLSAIGAYFREAVSGTGSTGGSVLATGGDSFLNLSASSVFNSSSITTALTPANGSAVTALNDKISFTTGLIPIQGWSSNAVTSEDLGGREVVVEGLSNAGQSITASVTPIPFTETRDTTASWDGATFTAPETGDYIFDGMTRMASSSYYLLAYVNGGSAIAVSDTNPAQSYVSFSGTVFLNKGDTLDIRSNTTTTAVADGFHRIHIAKLASPQTTLETETVAARYTSNAGFSIANASYSTIAYEDLDKDTHNAYNTSTGVYTIPVSGWYAVSAKIRLDSVTAGTGVIVLVLDVDNDGTYTDEEATYTPIENTAQGASLSVGGIYLTKGQEVVIRMYQDNGATRAVSTSSQYNSFSIARIK